ncbi:unnamed protein product [Microthlaspi erraticum]|uniref:Uncharacterized protein n=1 Tax=Microthlaspi erraticum TaxID=1685480 RepID=A0A6D2JZE1_9BRAS|nr:unnamed protein product [Microthlaspi erraticum]
MPNLRDFIRNSIAPSSYFNFTRRNRTSAQGFRLPGRDLVPRAERGKAAPVLGIFFTGSADRTVKVWMKRRRRSISSPRRASETRLRVTAAIEVDVRLTEPLIFGRVIHEKRQRIEGIISGP